MSLYGVHQRKICHFARSVLRSIQRQCSHAGSTDVPHVAIIGSGPAGFYTAQQLLKVTLFSNIILVGRYVSSNYEDSYI